MLAAREIHCGASATCVEPGDRIGSLRAIAARGKTRTVVRGLERRALETGRSLPACLGIDETSFQKRHEYVTVACDQRAGTVVHGRGAPKLGLSLLVGLAALANDRWESPR